MTFLFSIYFLRSVLQEAIMEFLNNRVASLEMSESVFLLLYLYYIQIAHKYQDESEQEKVFMSLMKKHHYPNHVS